ncbi:MAG: hypothetical protein JXR31_08175 [Prolixibacteraceae bacterium]|nr:hypothetical protein [Prolixibacteraceae bacterium]MBN2774211.1 hypothetical protein [Prolixibacteraceae bacterium]
MKPIVSGILILLGINLLAQDPVVENVRFEQRTDGSLMVDIYYDATSIINEMLQITIEASDDDGATWDLPCSSLDGDVDRVAPGKNKHVQWNFFADNPYKSGDNYRVRVTAEGLCHMFVTEDRTLDKDLVCDPNTYYAAIIGAPNITFNLDGHIISRNKPGIYGGGICAEDVEGTTIQNGTLEGFLGAIGLTHTDNATIEGIIIRNLKCVAPDSQITGMSIGRSKGVVIRDVQIEFPPVIHKEAINAGDGEITIDNLEVIGGFVGVSIGGNEGMNGSIRNSRFVDGGGILVATTSSLDISGNEFIRNECGIGAYIHGYKPFGIIGLDIDRNTFQDCVSGIVFWGIRESRITSNVLTNNARGIQLKPYMFCDPVNEPDSCFYSTENIILENVVLGGFTDLYHHEKCIGNTWSENIFWSKEGDEIPDCNAIVTTARESLSSINPATVDLPADAQLFFVNSESCDSTGKSCKWIYTFQSDSQQSKYEFYVKDGQIIKQDSVAQYFESFLPLQDMWIDSDSAVIITDSKGGKEFRETFELQNIKMELMYSELLFWNVYYIAKDTTLLIGCDALIK